MAQKVDSKHPEWTDRKSEWDRMRDCDRGEDAVKKKSFTYLPMPSGFGGENGWTLSASAFNGEGAPASAALAQASSMYGAYMLRAQFPEILSPTVAGIGGLIHRTEIQIEGIDGTGLAFLWEKCTREGLTLEEFAQQITREIVLAARFGILVDVPPDGGDGLPYFAAYKAETIINWADDRSFFVLDENRQIREGFEWKDKEEYRVLRLDGGTYGQQIYNGPNDDQGSAPIVPQMAAQRGPLPEIPFTIVGPREVSTRVESSPLKGVAAAALAAYRLDADYRHQLYMSGQETLFITGIAGKDAPKVVGAGVVHTLPEKAKAEYVGPKGVGIEAHRKAIKDEFERAVSAGARILDESDSPAESGAAKEIRYASETATLTSISTASAHALERSLRHAGRFIGMTDEQLAKISVKPNLRFVKATLTPAEAKDLVAVWMSGGISKRTLYENLQRGEIASSERAFEQEEAEIETEAPDDLDIDPDGGAEGGGARGGDDPDGTGGGRRLRVVA